MISKADVEKLKLLEELCNAADAVINFDLHLPFTPANRVFASHTARLEKIVEKIYRIDREAVRP